MVPVTGAAEGSVLRAGNVKAAESPAFMAAISDSAKLAMTCRCAVSLIVMSPEDDVLAVSLDALVEVADAPEEPALEPEPEPDEPELPPTMPPTTALTAVTVPETGAAREQDAKFLFAVSTATWAAVVFDVGPPLLCAELRAVAAEASCSLSLRAELACWLTA